jgi:cytochrome c-type biogenesis protein CcmE
MIIVYFDKKGKVTRCRKNEELRFEANSDQKEELEVAFKGLKPEKNDTT